MQIGEKMKYQKTNRKNDENKILEVVSRYKLLLCHQIKSGNSFNHDGLLFDYTAGYDAFWQLSSSKTLNEEEREIVRINFALSSLNKKEREIIWNEFFFTEDKFWWMRKYNRSTFYRLRAKAIANFAMLIK